MDIMDKIQSLSELGKSTVEKQRLINVSDAFYVWEILVMKLDIMETIQIFENMIEDIDLKIIKEKVLEAIQSGIDDMEELMSNYGIPFPQRPPAGSNSTIVLEDVTDRDIFQSYYEAIQSFFPILAGGFMNSTSPTIRKGFKVHMLSTMEVHEVLVEYGKFKGYLNDPPVFRS